MYNSFVCKKQTCYIFMRPWDIFSDLKGSGYQKMKVSGEKKKPSGHMYWELIDKKQINTASESNQVA